MTSTHFSCPPHKKNIDKILILVSFLIPRRTLYRKMQPTLNIEVKFQKYYFELDLGAKIAKYVFIFL